MAVVPEDEMVDTLVEWALFLHEEGVEATMARAESTRDAARKAAEEDRARNLDERGEDANAAETAIDLIRKR